MDSHAEHERHLTPNLDRAGEVADSIASNNAIFARLTLVSPRHGRIRK